MNFGMEVDIIKTSLVPMLGWAYRIIRTNHQSVKTESVWWLQRVSVKKKTYYDSINAMESF